MTIVDIAIERIKKSPVTYGDLNRFLIQKEIYSAAQILNRLETQGFVTSVKRPLDRPKFGRRDEKVYSWAGKERPKRRYRGLDPDCPRYLHEQRSKWDQHRGWRSVAARHEKFKAELEKFGFKIVLPSETTTGAVALKDKS